MDADTVKEADVTISGIPLTTAQSMALRVAVTSYAREMEHTGLGDDTVGKSIAAGYLRNCREIEALLRLTAR